MFTNLIESKRQAQRSVGGTFASVFLHAAVIAALVVLTLHAGEKVVEKLVAENVKFAETKKDPPPEEKKPPPQDVWPRRRPPRASRC